METRSADAKTSHQPLICSDSLPHLVAVAANIPVLAPLVKNVIRVGVVVDAHVVQQELRWRLGRRRKPEARTAFHEAIASSVIVPFAPIFLDSEIEEHLMDIAKATRTADEDVRREWQNFRKLLHFYSPKEQLAVHDARVVDPDDLPYISVAKELGLPIYSLDRHYRHMRAPVISVLIDGTAKSYARSSSLRIAVMMGSTVTVTLSCGGIAAACRGIKRLARWFDGLHPSIQFAIVAAGIIAFAHPTSRAKLAAIWMWLKESATLPVLNTIADVAIQFAAANKTEEDTYKRLKESLPRQRRRSALMFTRAVCLAAGTPLSLPEIEKRIRADGYVTRSQNFGTYLRRVLLKSGQFRESSLGTWAFVSSIY